ncbi:putative cyclohexanone monooxygenase [Mycobacterium xenopi 3993]|nr:putative cyclohexanone monooxygenase [Mycobacterium xenopi 3993]
MQVIPEIAPIVKHLTVFQRTPIWCFPSSTCRCRAGALGDAVAGRQGGAAAGQSSLRRGDVSDPGALLHRLPAGQTDAGGGPGLFASAGPRPRRAREAHPEIRRRLQAAGFHNGYLATFNRDNVRLVTEPIDKITPPAWPPATARTTRSTCWCWRPASR